MEDLTEQKLVEDVIRIHKRRIQLERLGMLESKEYGDLFEAEELMLDQIVDIREVGLSAECNVV